MRQLANKEKEAEFKRNLIMESSWVMFMDKGFAATTMNDLAEKSDYALGTIYKLFKNKEEIFISLVKKKLEELHNISMLSDDPSKNPVERIRGVLNSFMDFFAKNTRMLQIFYFEYWTSDLEITKGMRFECRDHLQEFAGQFQDIVEKGIEQGYFRKVDPFMARLAVKALMTEFFWNKVLNGKLKEASNVVDDVMSFFLYGIANQPQTPKK
jgi:AcrR family transcriptional regulator